MNNWITTQDICRIFGVSETTIYKWRKKNDMPVKVIPGHKRNTIRYDVDEVKKWAEVHEKKIVDPIKE